MKPLSSTTADGTTLQDLGKASIQIVHDLKNQLNGLKLYATFLRRRIEKSERPEDEQQTITKLIAGLDRAANDLSTIVQYGRDIELKKQPGFDIQKVMRSICSQLNDNSAPVVCDADAEPLVGELDPTRVTDAFNWISNVAVKYRQNGDNPLALTVSVKRDEIQIDHANIEWSGLTPIDHDPFKSFVGTDEIRMSLAAKIIEAHGGSARYDGDRIQVTLPLLSSQEHSE
jgi:light-regulated signal transduction histidine kinase (bacteriophytochrome)